MSSTKFQKVPVVIDAWQWNVQPREEWPEWLKDSPHGIGANPDCLVIETLEGDMRAMQGDWIIRGVKGEIYPCKPDIFDQTYELYSETVPNTEGSLSPYEVCMAENKRLRRALDQLVAEAEMVEAAHKKEGRPFYSEGLEMSRKVIR